MPPRSRHPPTPTGYFRNGMPDLDDMFPVQIGKSGTFSDGNPQDVPPGLMLAITFNTGATATVQGVYRNGNTGQARSSNPGSRPNYYSGRLYQQVKPSAADANISWEVVDPMGLDPFTAASGSAPVAPTLTPWFIPIVTTLSPTSLLEQTLWTVPAGQIYELIDTILNNVTATSVSVTLKVYNSSAVIYDTKAFTNAGNQVTSLAPTSTSYAGAFVLGAGKATLTLGASAGASSTLVGYARRVA